MKAEERIYRNLDELKHLFGAAELEEWEELAARIARADGVFVHGSGRTRLVMSMFAMRLTQMGVRAYLVGEATTPAIGKGDLLLAGSGSGETEGVIRAAQKAQAAGATLCGITSSRASSLGRLAGPAVILPGRTKNIQGAPAGPLPLGSEFEQMLLLFLDALTSRLMETLLQTHAMMRERHANLE